MFEKWDGGSPDDRFAVLAWAIETSIGPATSDLSLNQPKFRGPLRC